MKLHDMLGKYSLNTLPSFLLYTKYVLPGTTLVCILLITALLSGSLGIAPLSLWITVSLLILILLLILNIPLKTLFYALSAKPSIAPKMISGVLLLLFSFFLLIVFREQMIWISSIPLFLSGLNVIISSVQQPQKELFLLAVSSFVYALFFVVVSTIPIVWLLFRQLSFVVSSSVGWLLGKPMILGPSMSGLWIVLIFFVVLFVGCFFSSRKHHRVLLRFLLHTFGVCCIWIFYLVLLSFMDISFLNDNITLHGVLFLICLPFSLYSFFSYLYQKPIRTPHSTAKKTPSRFGHSLNIFVVVMLLLAPLISMVPLGFNSQTTPKVTFYGKHMLGTWDLPDYGRYGSEASGMFGLLPLYVNAAGYHSNIVVENTTAFLNQTRTSVTMENITLPRYLNLSDHVTFIETKNLSQDILEETDIFVVINLNTSFSEHETTLLWEYVHNGGSLLVLGDHTNVGGIQQPLNHLLAPTGIQYRFDAALPLSSTQKWLPCYEIPYHPITLSVDHYNQFQLSVGASLDIPYTSTPLLIGKYAFSDLGDQENKELAFLGDYEYNHGEQLGDIILAAACYQGDGKLVVIGDTSGFQNSALPHSFPFVSSLFSWLYTHHSGTITAVQMGLSLVVLFLFFLVIITKRITLPFAVFPIVLCLSLLCSFGLNSLMLPQSIPSGNIVTVDASHGERFTLEPFTDTSLSGFMINLNRNGYLPVVIQEFLEETIMNSSFFICTAPTQKFTSHEVDFFKTYMQNGGVVLLSTGFEDKQASLPLLQVVHLDIENVPLGPFPYGEYNMEHYEQEPRFVDSWPIVVTEQNARSYYNFTWNEQDYHLTVFAPYGKGGLLLISDSSFLLDENLESMYDYWPGNILFLKNLLDACTIEKEGT
jgi:hypothetical protein